MVRGHWAPTEGEVWPLFTSGRPPASWHQPPPEVLSTESPSHPPTSTHTHTHTHKHTNTNEIPPPSSSKDAKSLTWSLCQVCLDRMGHHFVRSLGPYSMNCGKDSGIDSESWHFLLYTNFTHFKMETCLYLFKVICVVVPLIYVCVKNKRPPRYLAHGAQ